jgi:DNA gyrase subunit A
MEPQDPIALVKIPTNLADEMQQSYMAYAMSVIIGRALPDVRDGLKPANRRVLYGMQQMGLMPGRAYRKSAKIVGEVMGNYHPHGDQAIYDTLVRMAQPFNMRALLVDGQGNFGSVDPDPPAAQRYTEARLTRVGAAMMADIEKDTVDFQPTYDDSSTEPTVLPTILPNLLVNGAAGIAVGMATNIPPHNVGEVVNGLTFLLENQDLTPDERLEGLLERIVGPDFPTGGFICGRSGIRQAYRTGRGSITMRARAEIEVRKGDKESIVITEIPYQLTKTRLIDKIVELHREKTIEGIADVRDESDRQGMRIVVDVKKGEPSQIILNNLYKHTPLQDTFGVIMLAIVEQRPRVLTLLEVCELFIDFRRDVVRRRTAHDLRKAEARAHILEGYAIALDHLDEVIKLIRAAKNPEEARVGLIARFGMSEIQAKACSTSSCSASPTWSGRRSSTSWRDPHPDRRPQGHPGLPQARRPHRGRGARQDPRRPRRRAAHGDRGRRRRHHGRGADRGRGRGHLHQPHRLHQAHDAHQLSQPAPGWARTGGHEDARRGLRRPALRRLHPLLRPDLHGPRAGVLAEGARHPGRGAERQGQGRRQPGAPAARGEDRGLPGRAQLRGRRLRLLTTRKGIVKKTELAAFANPRPSGIIALSVEDDDALIEAGAHDRRRRDPAGDPRGHGHPLQRGGRAPDGRAAYGVKGIELESGDEVVALEVVAEGTVLTVTGNGYGKKTDLGEYRLQTRAARASSTSRPRPQRLGGGGEALRREEEVMLISRKRYDHPPRHVRNLDHRPQHSGRAA